MQSSFTFELDGESFRAAGEPIGRTLASYLDSLGLGRDGRFRDADPWLGGAPLLLLDADSAGRPALRAVDAALLPLPAVAGRQLWSAEALAARIHPAARLLAARPEAEMTWAGRARLLTALVEAWHRPPASATEPADAYFDGCLSRQADPGAVRDLAQSLPGPGDAADPVFSPILDGTAPEWEDLAYVDGEKRRFFRPRTLVEIAQLLAQYPQATLAGGGSSLTERPETGDCVVSCRGVDELRAIYEAGDHWIAGAAAPLTSVGEALGMIHPPLAEALRRFATRPIRNLVTLGGCLGAAQADDELSPVLIALDASVRAVSQAGGERLIPVGRFFEGGGRTNLRPGEFIAAVAVPKHAPDSLHARGAVARYCGAYKAAARRQLTPGAISGAFAVELDAGGRVTQAILAYAGVADRPLRAREAEKRLAKLKWCEETVLGMLAKLSQEIEAALPPGERAAIAALPEREREYRRQVVIMLLQKFFHDHPGPSEDGLTTSA